MIIKNNIQIFDDNGINVDGKLCVFKYSYEEKKHPLDGVYGISGAERDPKDIYIVEVEHSAIGIYNQNTMVITTVHNNIIDVKSHKIKQVAIIDCEKLIKEHLMGK